jgi:phosphomannomutase
MPKQLYTFDGYRIEYEDWWYNVRVSNTENYLRIVVEADAKEIMQKRVKQIKEILNDFCS